MKEIILIGQFYWSDNKSINMSAIISLDTAVWSFANRYELQGADYFFSREIKTREVLIEMKKQNYLYKIITEVEDYIPANCQVTKIYLKAISTSILFYRMLGGRVA